MATLLNQVLGLQEYIPQPAKTEVVFRDFVLFFKEKVFEESLSGTGNQTCSEPRCHLLHCAMNSSVGLKNQLLVILVYSAHPHPP